MNTTETATPNIIQLIGSVMADVTHVGKDGWNPGQKFHFRGIDAVVNAVGPALRKAGVVPTPVLETATYRDILTGGNRTPMQQCTVQVRYQFWGPAGDHLDVVVPGEAFDSGDKGTAKAMSVAYRIALLQLLALPTDEPDPDATSYERAAEVVTDPQWLADVRARIGAADSRQALQAIGGEIGTRANSGGVSIADGTDLQGAYDARWAALAAETATDEDPWATMPQASPPSPLVPTADQTQIDALVGGLRAVRGIDNPKSGLAAVSAMVRRDITDLAQLTQAEARSILVELRAEDAAKQKTAAPNGQTLTTRFATPEQLTKIRVVFNENGVRDRDEILRAVSTTVGRPIETTKQLTVPEASLVIETYQRKTTPEPAPANEGISVVAALAQIIDDAHTAEEFDQARADIEREHAEGTIGGDELAALQAQWTDRRNQARQAVPA